MLTPTLQRPEYLTKEQFASMVSISTRTVERLLASGVIAKTKIGGSTRIKLTEVKNYLDKQGSKNSY